MDLLSIFQSIGSSLRSSVVQINNPKDGLSKVWTEALSPRHFQNRNGPRMLATGPLPSSASLIPKVRIEMPRNIGLGTVALPSTHGAFLGNPCPLQDKLPLKGDIFKYFENLSAIIRGRLAIHNGDVFSTHCII